MATEITKQVMRAGDIEFVEISITSLSGEKREISSFIAEFNLFEDMYSPGLYGNILVVDAANVANAMNLVGDETILVKIRTPTLPDESGLIYKEFKVYSITDRVMISDTGKQSYTIHFCSPELWIDNFSPIYKTYTGDIGAVVDEIFTSKLSVTRFGSDQRTELTINGPTQNQVKFTSPGWTPVQAINWLASKALGQGYKNPGYLFFESNKRFYFANIEAIIDDAIRTKNVFLQYKFVAKRLVADPSVTQYNRDINDDYTRVSDMQVVQSFNAFKNLQNGYYGNKLFTLDLQTKEYNGGFNYNHVDRYGDYKHLENIGGLTDVAPFGDETFFDPSANRVFYPKNRNLYTGYTGNVSDVIEQTLPQRTSTLNELNNFKIEITVPGRTDVEVGKIIEFIYPDASPRDETDKASTGSDTLYTGYYLITAIRHKCTLSNHVMTLELSKDSLRRRPGMAAE